MILKQAPSIFIAVLLIAGLLAACSGGQSAAPTATQFIASGGGGGGVVVAPAPADTTTPTPGGASLPGQSSNQQPNQTPTSQVSTPLPGTGGTSASGSTQVTLADNGTSITLKVGQTFLLDLGAQYNWEVSVIDPSIVSRVVGITVIRGAQGVYRALAPGTTTLVATGTPACSQSTSSTTLTSTVSLTSTNSTSSCPVLSQPFEVTLIVS